MSKIESRGHVDNDIKHNAAKINAVEDKVVKLEAKIAELEAEIKSLKAHK